MSWKKYLDYDFENDIDDIEREARDRAVDEDLAKVRSIVESCDMKSSKEVTRIYLLVKDYKIAFKTSKVRNNFLSYLAETAAVNRAREAERNVKINKRLNTRKVVTTIVGFALIIISLVILAYNISERNNRLEQQGIINDLQQMHKQTQAATEETAQETEQKMDDTGDDAENDTEDEDSSDSGQQKPEQKKIHPELSAMYELNSDLAGWISIAGTSLDYPVLKGIDNDYYLERDFYGQNTKLGSIFMDYRNDYDDINMIIYGHNSSGGQMFGTLNSYRTESFYNAHKEIKFDTLYEHHTYEIIAVCLGRVRYIDEEGFRYYNYTDDEYEIDSFFMDMRKQSIYPVTYEFGKDDRFITLSTCSNDSDDGRLYLVAVRKD